MRSREPGDGHGAALICALGLGALAVGGIAGWWAAAAPPTPSYNYAGAVAGFWAIVFLLVIVAITVIGLLALFFRRWWLVASFVVGAGCLLGLFGGAWLTKAAGLGYKYTWPSMPSPPAYLHAPGRGLGAARRRRRLHDAFGQRRLHLRARFAGGRNGRRLGRGRAAGRDLPGRPAHAQHERTGHRAGHRGCLDLLLVELDDRALAAVARPGQARHGRAVGRSGEVREDRPGGRPRARRGHVAGRAVGRDLLVVRPLVQRARDVRPVGSEQPP